LSRLGLARLALAVALSSATACSLRDLGKYGSAYGQEDAAGSTGDACADVCSDVAVGIDAAADVIADAGSETSLETGPPVEVCDPKSRFCIDATEVTNGDYAQFVAAVAQGYKPDFGVCAAGGVVPDAFCESTIAHRYPGATDFPVVCISNCLAHAYCLWAGKHLCGGFDGGSLQLGEFGDPGSDPTMGEWGYACSAAGARLYPYGGAYEAGACNTADQDAGLLAVGSKPACVGGFAGLLDMAGNANEWIASCGTGANVRCQVCGGSYSQSITAPPGQCACESASFGTPYVYVASPDVGFRCCREPH
jgi:formylglycine-generating enzyme required for sulfatase activity